MSSRILYDKLEIKIYKTIILSVVLYGYETLYLTLKEENKLGVCENKILVGISRANMDENWEFLTVDPSPLPILIPLGPQIFASGSCF